MDSSGFSWRIYAIISDLELRSGYLRYIVDLTIAYPKGNPLSLLDVVTGYTPPCVIRFHYRVYNVKDVSFARKISWTDVLVFDECFVFISLGANRQTEASRLVVWTLLWEGKNVGKLLWDWKLETIYPKWEAGRWHYQWKVRGYWKWTNSRTRLATMPTPPCIFYMFHVFSLRHSNGHYPVRGQTITVVQILHCLHSSRETMFWKISGIVYKWIHISEEM